MELVIDHQLRGGERFEPPEDAVEHDIVACRVEGKIPLLERNDQHTLAGRAVREVEHQVAERADEQG